MAMEPRKKRMWGEALCVIGVLVFLVSPLLPYLSFIGLTAMIMGVVWSNSSKKNTESKARTENGFEFEENHNKIEIKENETKKPVKDKKCDEGEIDDLSYIQTFVHTGNGKWEQHDVVLDTTIYGWENMYSDASAQITETKYQAAVELMNEGKYEEAISAFKALNRYSDSANQILECQYRKASKLLVEGKYAESAAIFITIKGYKDVDSLLVKDENLSAAAAREAKWQVGNYVTFGTYPQTKEGNDSTPIQWIVLARDGDKALVISKYALDSVRYHREPYYREDFMWVDWGTCCLRTWLNNDFYNIAFSAEEKRNVVLSRVAADKNPKYSTNPGKDTNDNVFLLSITEVNNYFKDDVSRMCAPTDYAVKNGAFPGSSYKVDGRASCWWWLRSPGNSSEYAADVYDDGSVDLHGNLVNLSFYGVRPCMWVRLF